MLFTDTLLVCEILHTIDKKKSQQTLGVQNNIGM